jgi:hypothetical protein
MGAGGYWHEAFYPGDQTPQLTILISAWWIFSTEFEPIFVRVGYLVYRNENE